MKKMFNIINIIDIISNVIKKMCLYIKDFFRRHKHDWLNPKFFTLVILPHDGASVKKLNISSNFFKAIVVISVVFWLASLFMFFSYFNLKNKVVRLAEVEKINIKQREELNNLNSKIRFLETQLARLQNVDLKIREMVNLDVKGEGVKFAGGIASSSQESSADKLMEKAEALEKEIKVREKSLSELAEYLEDRKSLFMATPSLWPARGFITSEFGWRKDPLTGSTEYHEGVDIAGAYGAPVRAAAEGLVIESGNDAGYGKVVVIDHGYGIVTRYAHLSRSYVVVGQKVKKGGVIGAVGSSGKSTGPHVHYEVRIDGVPVNPVKYLFS